MIHGDPTTGQVARVTSAGLPGQASALGTVLQGLGGTNGDRVIIHMPMVLLATFAMLLRSRIGAVAAFRIAIEAKRLAKTRSGKVLRGTVQKIANSLRQKMPTAIDDPDILEGSTAALRR